VTQFYGICEAGFQGLMHDEESGLIYNRHRDSDTMLERFMEEDPKGYRDGLDLFQYERSNPVDYRDPSGLVVGPACKPPKCSAQQKLQDQMGYGQCIQAVDADIGQQEQQLDANYQKLVAQIAAAKAACNSGCASKCQALSPSLQPLCVFSCQKGCNFAFTDAQEFALAGYYSSLAALGIQQQAAYSHCWSLFPCAVPESGGGDPYFPFPKSGR
jgi:RHS repeat-associated protein